MIEELLVLEDKLSEIIISLNTEKSISNYCFDFWNYFYENNWRTRNWKNIKAI